MLEEQLFLDAMSIPDAGERAAYLDGTCGGDDELRARVESLLAAHDGVHFLDRPIVTQKSSVGFSWMVRPPERAGSSSARPDPGLFDGRYRLGEVLGEGGMGTVYRAEQFHPVRRTVALKLIRAGMDTAGVLARFDAERQALAVMDHPGIAKVFDAGTTENGRPYFAMEFVDGLPLTEYCQARSLSLRDRLLLIVQISQAVQHAHQKGVIHRDLKPANVLVVDFDGVSQCKIIDFGLAKALSAGILPDVTRDGAAAASGTPLYMAPEQADPLCRDIDTRVDVYALGVILYEILTGQTPIGADSARAMRFDELMRSVREVDPPPPSARLAAAATPDSLRTSRTVRGDLDWVTMKCLEKDRERRYETANAVALEIQRFLAHEPVLAGPPGRWYRAQKFVRRNRGAVAAAAAVALALGGGFVGTALGLREARVQEAEAKAAAGRERTAKDLATTQLGLLEKDYELFTSIFNDLDVNDVNAADGPIQAVLAKRLVEAAKHFDGEAAGDPLMIAGLRFRLGEALKNLGYPRDAVPLFEKSHAAYVALNGPDDELALEAQDRLAETRKRVGNGKIAIALFADILERKRRTLGPTHPSTLRSQHHHADNLLNISYFGQALPLLLETLELMRAHLGPEDLDTVTCMADTAACYRYMNQLDKAIPMLEETLAIRRKKLPADHPLVLNSTHHLAAGYEAAKTYSQALPLYERAYVGRKAKLGPEHEFTVISHEHYARALVNAGEAEKGIAEFDRFANFVRPRVSHPWTYAEYANRISNAFIAGGQPAAAEPYLLENLAIHTTHSPTSWREAYLRSQLGWVRFHQNRFDEAETLMTAAYRDMSSRKALNAAGARQSHVTVCDQFIAMFEARGKPEEVVKWRAERAKNVDVPVK